VIASGNAHAFQPPLIYRGPIGERLTLGSTTAAATAATATAAENVAEAWRQIERDARAGGRPEVMRARFCISVGFVVAMFAALVACLELKRKFVRLVNSISCYIMNFVL
jgi:hypothetical protein